MIGALKGSGDSALPSNLQAFGNKGGGKIATLMATHPPVDVRIARLRDEAGGTA